MSDEELQALQTGDLDRFSPRDRAALEFAGRLTQDSNRIGDALFGELRRHFDEGEVVEIATVAGLFNYFNRVNNALQMEPTR
ncbi:MAG: carboxymuconolactone decarboxylase family protein [Terriglobia bacterium]